MRPAFFAACASLLLALAFAPSSSARQLGTLDVRSEPPSAHIRIDGRDTGKTTPAVLELPAGHHELYLLTSDGALEGSMGFTVEERGVLKLSLQLHPRRGP